VAKSPDKKSKSKPAAKPKAKSPNPKPRTTSSAASPKQPKENEAQIAVHWKEEELFYPSPKFIAQANLNDPATVERFDEKHFPECFREYADLAADPSRNRWTIYNALTMTMGTDWDELSVPYSDPTNSEIAMDKRRRDRIVGANHRERDWQTIT